MLFNNLTVIFGGGVGKNGSTVAVSLICPLDMLSLCIWLSFCLHSLAVALLRLLFRQLH